MSRKTFLLAAIAVAASLDGLSAASAGPRVIDGFSMPESVLCRDGRCYVSNIGVALEPLKKDGDGFISLLDGEGRVLDRHALPPKGETLDAPKGMALAGGRLFVADIDRVVGFDLATGAKVFEARLEAGESGAILLNDLARENDGALLVTDTLGNAVYRLSLETGTFSAIARDVPGANGIVIDRDAPRAYVVGVGENFSGGDVLAIDLTGREPPRIVAERHGALDGIGQLADGDLVISDWTGFGKPVPGRLERVTRAGVVTPMPLGVDIHGPADFDLDVKTGKVWIPAMLDGHVVVVDSGDPAGTQ